MKEELKEELKRGIITLIVFIALYFLLPMLTQYKGYDVCVQSIHLMTSVIGAGCYWIGSK